MIAYVTNRVLVCAALAVAPMLVTAPMLARSCESLAGLKLLDTTVTAAQTVPAGAFTPAGDTPNAALAVYKKLPAFCRLQGLIRPTPDSQIDFEVWMPTSGWNGKYLGVGNGGLAGSINYRAATGSNAPDLAQALASGYAASSTDTGHKAVVTGRRLVDGSSGETDRLRLPRSPRNR